MNRLFLASALLLAGCQQAIVAPKTPAQAVYDLTAAYAAALDTVVACYHVPACSAVADKAAIKAAVDRATPAVDLAQTISRATNPDATLAANAITAAVAAVSNLSAITSILKVK